MYTITKNYNEDTNGVIKIRKSKDIQHKKKRKGTILQITIRKTRDREARISQKAGVNFSTSGTRHVTLATHPVISNE